MCGIAGVLAGDPGADATVTLGPLLAALAHRGPDGEGTCLARGRSIALGHRRLSILDLETGDQPMGNEDGRVRITYNGEIYNHMELRRELEARGHAFRTRSDTEVLVHGWEEWAEGLLPRLNGIYAFALLDERGDTPALVLARDPLGVKPLYLGRSGSDWWFASELAAARGAGLTGPLRRDAFAEFLVYRFVPSPGTFHENAWKVPPGHSCRLVPGASAPPAFQAFQPAFLPATLPSGAHAWEAAIRDGLAQAVRRQLMSDVPVGTLLSGGVDSTVVTALMRDGLADPPQAFAIGFADDPGGGELAVARRAAGALGVPLEAVTVREDEYRDAWLAAAGRAGEPIANSGAMMLGLLCRVAGRTHKVVLSGQGADEPLGGYPRHAGERWYPLARRMRLLLNHLPDRLAAADRVERMRRLAGTPDESRRFAGLLAVFAPVEAARLVRGQVDPDRLVDPVRRWLPSAPEGDSLNRLLYVDARLSLADDLLTVADHVAMAGSVELRVPFLDLELLALLERMPGRYKVSAFGERKWLYRRAVRPLLPPAVREALTGWRGRTGRKLGFTTPLDNWFGAGHAADTRTRLTGPGARLPEFLDPDMLRKEIAAAEEGRPRARQLMALSVLESWLRGVA